MQQLAGDISQMANILNNTFIKNVIVVYIRYVTSIIYTCCQCYHPSM